MNPILRNILAVIVAVISGGALNMGIIMISSYVIPPPDGTNLTTMEGLVAAMPLMEPKHFLMPFLAHALGTVLSAIVVTVIAVSHHLKLSFALGAWFLIGGIANIFMLPSPMWFTACDLILAYIPMAYFGYKIGANMNPKVA
jgi:hypothetical protein